MSANTMTGDQAIFTSIRSPTGEGYRIIAASRGLESIEKQAITRCSPSHDAMCLPAGDSPQTESDRYGVAFYPLPRGRLCVAVSQHAGAEHTGRGGQRVHTHNIVFAADELERYAFNPFAVARALFDATSTQLDAPAVLPELELPVTEEAASVATAAVHPALSASWRRHCLQMLLDERSIIIDLPDSWLATTEALIMCIPGPSRAKLSLSVGLRISTGRSRRLVLLHDDDRAARDRLAGRKIEWVDPVGAKEPQPPSSMWLSFVERAWGRDELARLAQRTSLPFTDESAAARERIAGLYNAIDAISDMDTGTLLGIAGGHLEESQDRIEDEISAELAVRTQAALLERLSSVPWAEARLHWHLICSLWRESEEGCLLAWPLIDSVLRTAAADDPQNAAEAALDLTDRPLSTGILCDRDRLIDHVLTAAATWTEQVVEEEELGAITRLHKQWRSIRPNCQIVERIGKHCNTLMATSSGT